METQFTDFENAAFCIFINLVKSVIVKYELNLYAPIADVQENMQRAHSRDAVQGEKFRFRGDPFGQGHREEDLVMLSVHEIVNGSASYVGLIPLIERYMREVGWSDGERTKMKSYLDLVSRRASGEYWTAAKWAREFVLTHEDYKEDSRVSSKICFEMMQEAKKMMNGDRMGRMFEKQENVQ